jgi:hypothetical protein
VAAHRDRPPSPISTTITTTYFTYSERFYHDLPSSSTVVTRLITTVTLKCRGILSSRLGRQATSHGLRTTYVITRNSTCIQLCVNKFVSWSRLTLNERSQGRGPPLHASVIEDERHDQRGKGGAPRRQDGYWFQGRVGEPTTLPAARTMKTKNRRLGRLRQYHSATGA